MKYALAAPLLILGACSGQSANQAAADAQADQLDNAAEQSTPEAAAELHDQADAMRENGVTGAPGEPGSSTQNAVEQAAQPRDDATQAPIPGAPPVAKQAPSRPVGTPTPHPSETSR